MPSPAAHQVHFLSCDGIGGLDNAFGIGPHELSMWFFVLVQNHRTLLHRCLVGGNLDFTQYDGLGVSLSGAWT